MQKDQRLDSYLSISRMHNRNHNLALRIPIASNVSRKVFHIGDYLCLFGGGGGSADAFGEEDGLACDLVVARRGEHNVRLEEDLGWENGRNER